MDINDIFQRPTGIQRPEHPDFWKLSEIILALKADSEDHRTGKITMAEFERRWRAHYEGVGDFDSIAYCAIQAGFAIHGIVTGRDWQNTVLDERKHRAYIATVQAYFDGFIMGALLERSRHANPNI